MYHAPVDDLDPNPNPIIILCSRHLSKRKEITQYLSNFLCLWNCIEYKSFAKSSALINIGITRRQRTPFIWF